MSPFDLPVYWIVVTGIAGASLFQYLLFLTAWSVSCRHWVSAYLTILVVCGACLSLQAWGLLGTWVNGVALGGLALAGVYGFLRKRPKLVWPQRSALNIGLAFLFAIEVLYAATPFYRKDQWDYSLVIPKILFSQGHLAPPIYNDHYFFTGGFEYFLGLFRYLTDNDLFVHSLVNSFCLLSFFLLSFGLIDLCRQRLSWKFSSVWALLVFFFAAMADRESIVNAKPDFLLTFFPGVILAYGLSIKNGQHTKLWFLVGAMLTLPLALKITWLHMMVPLAVGLLFLRPNFVWVMLGSCVGLLPAVLTLAKNFYFFANPLHPKQIWIFRTPRWNLASDEYWQTYMQGAHSLVAYGEGLLANLWQAPLRCVWFAIPIGVVLMRARSRWQVRQAGWSYLVVLGIYLLLWPLMFHVEIESRFVFSFFGLTFFAVLWALQIWPEKDKKGLALVLALPILLNASYEVKVRKVAEVIATSAYEMYDRKRGPTREALLNDQIRVHRHRVFPKAAYGEHIVVADTPVGYFLDTERIYPYNPDTTLEIEAFNRETGSECFMEFLQKRSIRYFLSYRVPLKDWLDIYQPVIPFLQPVGKMPGSYFIPDGVYPTLIEQHCLGANS